MRRKYEITITTTLSSPKGEGRDRGGGNKEMGRKGGCGATGRDGKRERGMGR